MTSHLDTYAALTALFTTSDETVGSTDDVSDPTPAIVVPPRPRIECIVPGHLPVRAGVWFLPCASRLAGAGNAGVLIHCEDGQAQLTAFGTNGASGDRTACLDALASQAQRWFLFPANDTDPAEYASLGADRITILTGTDQAAVVAAYQTIKSIVAGGGPEHGQIDLGVFVVGSEEAAAVEAAERLAETTRRQLGCDLQLRGSMPQLEAVDAALHREHVHLEGGAARLVSDIRRAMTVATVDAPRTPPVIEPDPIPAVAPPLAVAEAESAIPQIEVPVSTPAPERHDVIEPIEDEGHLATYVEGLRALPIRCPHHESIELAVDAEGAVQVLGLMEELPQLLAVEAWATSHADLVSRACRESSIRVEQSPVVHVFGESIGALNALQETSMRLHLLVTVEVGPHHARHATPLG